LKLSRGATQYLLELNIDLASVMQAGLEKHGHADALRRERLGGTRRHGAGGRDTGTQSKGIGVEQRKKRGWQK